MAFSIGVEMLNIRLRQRAARPVKLRSEYGGDGQAERSAASDATAAPARAQPVLRKAAAMPLIDRWMPWRARSSAVPSR